MKREGYTITDEANWYWFGHHKWRNRTGAINRIIPHHMAGNLTKKQFDNIMTSERQMSPSVAIYTDGTCSAYVPEEKSPWTTGGAAADGTALTLEIANDEIGGNWHISDKAYKKAVKICAEWCKRYGITPCYKPNKKGTIQMHKEWANTACPGPYLSQKITSGQFEKDILAVMNPSYTLYKVQCGAFKKKPNAVDLREKLKAAGFSAVLKSEDGWHRVQVGAYKVKANADAMLTKLNKAGFKGVIVTQKVNA